MSAPGPRALQDPLLRLGLAVGLVLRVAVAAWVHPERQPMGDEHEYWRLAGMWAESGRLETGVFVRPPLYILLLGGLHLLPLSPLATLAVLQSLAGVLTAIPTYRVAGRIGGRRAARFAAAFVLFDPTLVAYAHLVWPEILYLLGVSLVWDGVATLRPREHRRGAVLGALTGVCMLLKPIFGLFTPLLALWWWRRFGLRRALALSACFGLAAALVLAPWVVRNQLRYGGVILLENQAAYNLWIGNDPRPARTVLREYVAIETEPERMHTGFSRGLSEIADDPAGFASRWVRRAVNLWGLEYFVLRHAAFGGYGPPSKGGLLALFWTLQIGHALVLGLAAVGIARRPRGTVLDLLLVFAGVFTALVATMVGTTRFAVPFALPLAVFAGLGVCAGPGGLRERRSQVALALALLLLGISASRPVFRPYLTGDFDSVFALRSSEWFFLRY